MRKLLRILAATFVVMLLMAFTITSLTVVAETGQSLGNFNKTVSGSVDTFKDVRESDWFYKSVIAAYSYGIVSGVGGSRFNPSGNLTGAEALTFAAKVHSIYTYGNGSDMAINKYIRDGGAWYDVYVRYCKAEGLIGDEFDAILTKPVTKAQMVFAWSKVLLPADMPEQNVVQILPDVDSDTPYLNEILAFYRAGITTGIDSNGTFKPNSNITRAEAAAIVLNIIEKEQRSKDKEYIQVDKL